MRNTSKLLWLLPFILLSNAILANEQGQSQMKCKIESGHLAGSSLIVKYDLKAPSHVQVTRDDAGKTVDEQNCELEQDGSAVMSFLCRFRENGRRIAARYLIRKGRMESRCQTTIDTVAGKFDLPDAQLSCI